MSNFKVGDKVKSKVTSGIFTVEAITGNYVKVRELGILLLKSNLELVQSHKNQVIDQMNAERELILQPGEVWQPGANKQCTCGISSIGGGIHSDWCDLYE